MENKKSLLIIAHGSPRKQANDEIIKLAKKIRARKPRPYVIQHAFLDCASPNISQGIDLLAQKGLKKITVLPFFLVSGKHTQIDIPKILKEKRKQYKEITIHLKKPLGQFSEMIDWIVKSI